MKPELEVSKNAEGQEQISQKKKKKLFYRVGLKASN